MGKTSLVSRFLGGKFEECYTPTIEDFHRKLYRIRGEVHQLDLLDTSGNHPFPAMRRLSFLTGEFNEYLMSISINLKWNSKRMRCQWTEWTNGWMNACIWTARQPVTNHISIIAEYPFDEWTEQKDIRVN